MIWPPNYLEEYDRRRDLLIYANNEPPARAKLQAHYRFSLIDWVKDFAITYDPRKAGASKIIPFVPFPRQEEFLQYLLDLLKDRQPGLVEKSRDMGATWLCCATSIWLWLYTPGASVGWGSRDEDTVDKRGDPDSIFEKMRFQLDYLPAWMLPQGYKPAAHCKFMTIINPENKASIKGDAGDNIGRGGRSMIYFKDESAHYEHPEAIEAALGDNTDVQVDISSVNGTGNVFHRRRMAGELWTPGRQIEKGKTRVFVLDWRDHPGKDQAWYDARRKHYEDMGLAHLVAQEVDRDYAAAIRGVIIPADWVNAAIDAHVKLNIPMDGEKIAALDVAGGDSETGEKDEGGDKHADAVRHGVVLLHADCWSDGDPGQAAQRAYLNAQKYACTELNYDCIGVGAGVKVETNRMREAGQIPAAFKILPWNAAETPENPEWHLIRSDYNTPKIGDFFLNRKAQAWWSLSARFEKTFKAVTRGEDYDAADLISISSAIPMLHQLKLELSQPVWRKNGKGKLFVDKKPKGSMSPNLADAVMMDFNPMRVYGPGLGYLEYMGRVAVEDQKKKLEQQIARGEVRAPVPKIDKPVQEF